MTKLMTVAEAADLLRLTEDAVEEMLDAGEIPGLRMRGEWRLVEASLQRWIEDLPTNAGTRPANASGPAAPTAPTSSSGPPAAEPPPGSAVPPLTELVAQAGLHRRFLDALGPTVVWHSKIEERPFDVDIAEPVPTRVRAYLFNATRPPGGRPLGEHKIQLIMPGQKRGERGSLTPGDAGRTTLLVGYTAEEDVFVLWDAGLYVDFAWSRNVQVKAETIMGATVGRIALQQRRLRPATGEPVTETLLACQPEMLSEAIARRIAITRDRLIGPAP